MKQLLSTLFLLSITSYVLAQSNIIPIPVQYESHSESFVWDHSIKLDLQSNNGEVFGYLDLFLNFLEKGGFRNAIQSNAGPGNFRIQLNSIPQADLGKEGYTLSVKADGIQLNANEPAGIFNGLQTLKQLFPVDFEANQNGQPFSVGGCMITDYPRFGWRGLMLDVSRHFFQVEDVKAFIDQMARYKLNTFHWHLTDDEGWRVEIKSLPKLTEVGAWRVERHGRFGESRPYPKPGEKATYGGFYTQEQIKEVVQYAAERNITIVPEIDIPGHSMAALAAYPELSTKQEPKFVNPGSKFAEWYGGGKFKMLIENTLNPADEAVYEFVDQVMTEVAQLFPGQYIHMGGDECYKGYWEEDPGVQQFMKANNIHDVEELQSYFVKRVEKIISSKGKTLIGWDEILEGGLAEGAAVMSWRGMKGGIEAAKMGHQVVMSPTTFAYLDYTQGDPSVENRIYANLSLEKCYSFEPLPEGVDPQYILGGQGNVWAEVIPNIQYAFYMTYPRALALSETLWSPKASKDWTSFITRTEHHFDRFAATGTNISKAVLEPQVKVYKEGDKLMCKLNNSIPNAIIYYTIDNTYPVNFGQVYRGPFEVPAGNLHLRTQTFRDGNPLGRELILHRDVLEKRAK